jgi:membrane protein YqaA with SNARE-associated domain
VQKLSVNRPANPYPQFLPCGGQRRPPMLRGRAQTWWDRMFKKLYNWTISLAESRHATWALAGIAFAESSFFPLPPDLILLPMALAKPKKAWFYAAVCSVSSVLGGILGYMIGSLLYDTVGQWIIHFYQLGPKVEGLRADFSRIGGLVILIKGVTPIPFKLVTITCGLLGYNFALFVLFSAITRSARFFIVAAATNRYGDFFRVQLEKHFAVFLVGLLAIIVAGFYFAAKVI